MPCPPPSTTHATPGEQIAALLRERWLAQHPVGDGADQPAAPVIAHLSPSLVGLHRASYALTLTCIQIQPSPSARTSLASGGAMTMVWRYLVAAQADDPGDEERLMLWAIQQMAQVAPALPGLTIASQILPFDQLLAVWATLGQTYRLSALYEVQSLPAQA